MAASSSPCLPPGGPEPVEHFGGPVLGGLDQRQDRLAGLDVGDACLDQRMVRKNVLERCVSPQRFLFGTMAGLEPRIGVDEAENGLVFGIGRFEPLRGFWQVVGHVGDQRRVVIAEHREPAIPQAVDRRQGLLLVPLPRVGPRGEQRGRYVMLPAGAAARELMPGRYPMAVLHLADAEHHMGEAVLGVDLDEPAAEDRARRRRRRWRGTATKARSIERPRLRGSERSTSLEIGRRGGLRVAVGTGDERREIIAGDAAADVERGGRDHD